MKVVLILSLFVKTAFSNELPKFISADESIGDRNQTIRVITTITFGNKYFDLFFLGIEATRLALNQLSLQPNWLPGYKLELEMIDDLCRDSQALNPLMRKLLVAKNEPRFPLAYLTECEALSQHVGSQILESFNFTGQSFYENTLQLEKRRHKLPNYLGLGQRADYVFFGLIALCKQMNWTRIALVSEIDPYYDLVSLI